MEALSWEIAATVTGKLYLALDVGFMLSSLDWVPVSCVIHCNCLLCLEIDTIKKKEIDTINWYYLSFNSLSGISTWPSLRANHYGLQSENKVQKPLSPQACKSWSLKNLDPEATWRKTTLQNWRKNSHYLYILRIKGSQSRKCSNER